MEYYTWILTFHIMAVLSWMSMLFYLPRIFVYHVENIEKKEYIEIAKVQERKLYKFIGLPAMWATIFSGASLIFLNPDIIKYGPWLHAKLFVLLFLIAYSFSLNFYREQLENDTCKKTGNFFRAYNEVPTVLSLLIVAYAITKTFSLLFTGITLAIGAFIIYKVLNQKPKG
ncbi:MAG: protoporphyrinogen oxidase HemJ [Campylobacterales bacterium]|nr:protoporphyrinogen oxidase HemJ [Campylobacterales bacterium]